MKQFWNLKEKIKYQNFVGHVQYVDLKKKIFYGSFKDEFNKEFIVEFDLEGFSTSAGKALNLKATKEAK